MTFLPQTILEHMGSQCSDVLLVLRFLQNVKNTDMSFPFLELTRSLDSGGTRGLTASNYLPSHGSVGTTVAK